MNFHSVSITFLNWITNMDEWDIKQKDEVLHAIQLLENDIFLFTKGETQDILSEAIDNVRNTFELNYPWT